MWVERECTRDDFSSASAIFARFCLDICNQGAGGGDSLLSSGIASWVWRGCGSTMLNESFHVTASLTFPNLVLERRRNTFASVSELGKQMRPGRPVWKLFQRLFPLFLTLPVLFWFFFFLFRNLSSSWPHRTLWWQLNAVSLATWNAAVVKAAL